jgi:4-carboxymuconolactone decarboxylase
MAHIMRLAAAFVAVCWIGGPLAAQDRMPSIPADKLTEAQKKAAAEFSEGRGYDLRGPWVPLLRSPDMLLRAKGMSDYLRFQSKIEERIKEMMILIAAREWTQQYVWNSHYPAALKAGLKREVADAIADSRRPAGMAEDEEIAYDLATEILRLKRVSDPAYERAVAKFGEQGVVDLVSLVGYYNLLAIVMNTTRTPLRAGTPEPLKRYPN